MPIAITKVPGSQAEFDSTQATSGTLAQKYNLLIFGQKLSAGTQTADTIERVLSKGIATTMAGRGSQAERMLHAALDAGDGIINVFFGALADDGGAVAATKTLTFVGTATAAGTVSLYIGGQRVTAAVAVGGNETAAALSVSTALSATGTVEDLPFTAAAVDGVVTLTAKNKGSIANDIDVRHSHDAVNEKIPAGLTLAIAAGTAGATDPALAGIISAMADDWYHMIAGPYTDATSYASLKTMLDDRAEYTSQIDGSYFSAKFATAGTLTTLGGTVNSEFIHYFGLDGMLTPNYEFAAAAAAIASKRWQSDAARPLQNLAVPGVIGAKGAAKFTITERSTLLGNGIATMKTDADGTVRIERPITTYQTSAAGVPDTAYLDGTTTATLRFLRFDLNAAVLLTYPDHKLGSDGKKYAANQKVVTPSSFKAFVAGRMRIHERNGLLENVDALIENLDVSRNLTDRNRLDNFFTPDLMNQFRHHAATIAFKV